MVFPIIMSFKALLALFNDKVTGEGTQGGRIINSS